MTALPLPDFYRGRLLVFAHRGARQQAPENTLSAFLRAAELGADGVELDVQLTADAVPVVIHDGTLSRTTDGSGRVAELPWAALRELDAGAWFRPEFAGTRIPTLTEVFETLGGRLLINIELKDFSLSARLASVVIETVHRHNMAGQVLFSSFNPLMLRHARRLAPEIPVGYLYAPDLPLPLAKGWLARPVIGRHEARHPHFSMVDQAYMAWARRSGYRVNVWTVNGAEDIRRMRDLGVDMIISDVPDHVRAIVDQTG
ncbi:MAG: glycerophosphodiester phosphodiesterase [Anaerolineae bacterium]